MTKKITSLTKEQEAKFADYVQKWTEIGLSCEPLDRVGILKHIERAYAMAKPNPLKMPEQVFFFDSPLAALLGVNLYMYAKEMNIPLKNLTMKDVEAVLEKKIASFCNYGSHEAAWLSFYDYMREVLGLVEETEEIEGIKGLLMNSGWFWCYEDVIFISERHNVCKVNDFGRLHCDNGPAVAYKDGYAIYAIDGVVVPEKVVMQPETLTIKEIEGEENAEIKRIMINRYGVGKYLSDIGAEVVDVDTVTVNKFDGKDAVAMPRALMRAKDGAQYMCGTDGSTERVYYMNVDPSAKTCKEAHESICSFKDNKIVVNS